MAGKGVYRLFKALQRFSYSYEGSVGRGLAWDIPSMATGAGPGHGQLNAPLVQPLSSISHVDVAQVYSSSNWATPGQGTIATTHGLNN
jgi:hypothetical protein